MTPTAFKTRLTALFGEAKYERGREYYMQVYAAAYKADQLDEISAILDFIEASFRDPNTVIANPEAYFAQFKEKDDDPDDLR